MKKLFFCAALVTMIGIFASCDKNKVACWQVNVILDGGQSYTEYIFGTREQAETLCTALEAEFKLEGEKIKTNISELDKTQSECDEANY